MKSLQASAFVVAVILLSAGRAKADMPGRHTPRPTPVPPPNAVPIRLEEGGAVHEATLYLPKNLLSRARATKEGKASTQAAPLNPAAGVGLAATAAVVGLGFFRLRNRPRARALGAVLLLSGLLIAGWIPLQARPPVRLEATAAALLPGGVVKIEVANEGDEVRLVVPKSQLAAWRARLRPAAAKDADGPGRP